jgi:glycosyltransferase involved in cell wall biosynthesis
MKISQEKICFSLLVPSYNRPALIRETVLSLLENSAPDVEIIVSDDASPKQVEIRASLVDLIEAGKIKYLQHQRNCGPPRNNNSLVDAASGEYVILLGDDDRLKPGAINSLKKWTAKYPEVSIFGFGYDMIDEQGDRIHTFGTPKPVFYEMNKSTHWKEVYAYDVVPGWSHHPFTLCSKRDLMLQIRYNTSVDISYDHVFLCDALEQSHKVMAIPEILFEWRIATDTTGNYATLSGNTERCLRSRGLILAEWLNRPALRQEVATLLADPQFLRRFCGMFRESNVHQLRRMLEIKPVDGKALADFISKHAMIVRPSLLDLLQRHAQATKVMGFKHVLHVLRYKWDKNRLNLRTKAV